MPHDLLPVPAPATNAEADADQSVAPVVAAPAAEPPVDAAPPALALTLALRGKINFASAQNRTGVLTALEVANHGEDAVEDLTLHLAASPAVLREKSWRIDRLAAGTRVAISDLDVALDTAILGGLDEAEIGQLTFRLTSGRLTSGEVELHAETHQIELLARDEWGGLGQMDRLLAAFVSPNHPQVARLLKEAARLLEAAGHSGAMDGYQQNDPQRVWMLAGAIWSAATGLGLTYALPPASFERNGQKIRDPERIVSEGLATCLDSALLMAAAFEAAGLNTAVLFSRGHAWVGLWLVKQDFGRLIEPDVVTVRKAVAARDFVALETTLLTRRPSIGFEEAAAAGRAHLSEANETEFERAIDINRARAAQIRPLASHRDPTDMPEPESAAPAALPRPLDLGRLPGELVDETPTTAPGRIERWQRKLLDLSLANRLLNFRETKLSVPLLCADLPALEDQLSGGKSFRLLALKDENALSGRDLSAEELRGVELDLARNAQAAGQIAVPLTAKEMGNRLTEIYRRSRSDLQEGGTNTLFLAVGFLRWKRVESEEKHYRAPLLLMPVKLERRSAQSEFRLSLLEDEVRINATLLELLKRDFELRIPELEGELPGDESGLDIPRILDILRQRIRDVAGFEVVEESALATFSFAKYLMWKDLADRIDSLRESPLVRHLVDNPSESFEGAASPMPRPEDIDRNHQPADILAPLPADSSQLAAVVAAAEGRDFVLIGPPGTGKSQTITNIIADQLGRGRTVLFVAEKAAALDVVQRRLERQGLGAAVLELHSNKADRKRVLTQLGRAWDRASAASEQDWLRVTDDLRLSRDQLNAYVEALHAAGTQGFSVYQAVGRASGTVAPFALIFDGKDCHDAQSYARLRELAAELGQRHGVIADLDTRGPLSLLAHAEWSYGWQDEILIRARALRLALTEVKAARAELGRAFGCNPALSSVAAALDALPAARLRLPAVADAALHDPAGLRAAIKPLGDALTEAAGARRALSASYGDATIAAMPLDALELQWREAQTKFWPLGALARGKVAKLLQTYASAGKADPAADLAALRRLQPALAVIGATPLAALPDFAGEKTDPESLGRTLDAADAFLRLEADLAATGIAALPLRHQLAGENGGPLGPLLQRLETAKAGLTAESLAFADQGGRLPDDEDATEALLTAFESQRARFNDWLKWRDSHLRAGHAGLLPLIESLESGALSGADAAEAFEAAYAAWWLRLAMDASPVLRGFAHWEHDALIRRFRELDQKASDLASGEVMRRLGNDLPARDAVPRKSELGLLRHQLGLQRPTAAIRNLIGQMPTSFAKLAPCVLMSPLSVAQYLPPGQALFDLVIFDEASQISTWDAIGAIARGRQAIIVGDPKQLPPTNFFGRNDEGEGDSGEVQEFEKDMPSILDEVAVAGIPTQRLNWHYRSRDEALIAFSNHNYYDGNLVTFPSPRRDGNALRLHAVKGTYLRGTGRTNPEEARAIVALIRQRLAAWLTLPEDKRPTLGVITFNVQQQGLILDLLDAERKAEPAFEWFFSDDREEPLIVKNLENIQGDERDVMLFSITFGPDQAGKTAMNFGALNGTGGEKRLNVAVTRARAELHVFTSILADQIDLARTSARGVRDLKAFLDFAQRGAVALAGQDQGSLGAEDSPFEVSVRAALEQKGWELRPQIGVSGFRIDLGVVHPDHAGAWLAGVECDGATYHRSATARDRDRIRQAVLEGLGWTILRIWSTDWFRDPAQTAARIDTALHDALAADRERRATALPVEDFVLPEPEVELPPDPQPVGEPPEAQAETAAAREEPAHAPYAALPAGEASAEKADLPDPDRFFDDSYTPLLIAMMERIIAAEAPLAEAGLARRIAQDHGWQRTGARIQSRVGALHARFDLTLEGEARFLWPRGSISNRSTFRGLAGRTLREISRAEIAALADLHADRLAESGDPEQELARLMGIARLSQDARAYLRDCRDWAAETAS